MRLDPGQEAVEGGGAGPGTPGCGALRPDRTGPGRADPRGAMCSPSGLCAPRTLPPPPLPRPRLHSQTYLLNLRHPERRLCPHRQSAGTGDGALFEQQGGGCPEEGTLRLPNTVWWAPVCCAGAGIRGRGLGTGGPRAVDQQSGLIRGTDQDPLRVAMGRADSRGLPGPRSCTGRERSWLEPC